MAKLSILIVLIVYLINNHIKCQQQQLQQPMLLNQQIGPQQYDSSAQQSSLMQMNIYQFLKQTQTTTRFAELIDRIAQQTGDRTIVALLNGEQIPAFTNNNGLTVFVPVNDALNNMPTNFEHLRNEILNLIVKERLTLDQLRGLDGRNITRTFGYKPNLILRAVRNYYYRNQYQQQGKAMSGMPANNVYQQQQQVPSLQPPNMMPQPQQQPILRKVKRQQPQPNAPSPQLPIPNQMNQNQAMQQQQQYTTLMPNGQTIQSGEHGVPIPVPNQPNAKQYSNFPIDPNQQLLQQQQQQQQQSQQQYFNQMNMYNSDASVYEMYASMHQGMPFDNLGISSKLPLDELFLLNSALIIDRYELRNGNVFLLKTYPRYFDKSLLMLLQDNDVPGMAQNLNFWTTRATQSYRLGDENLRNALNIYSPNTYFLPIDSAFNKFNTINRDNLLNNNTFLFDVLFRSHRISNRILFDYYLDDTSHGGFFTDTGLPVSTKHKRVNGVEEIEISISHVKGRILPEYRNIHCASGVIHLIDTVLGVPSLSAYQEIINHPDLSIFRSFVERSTRYRQLLDQSPQFFLNQNQNYFNPNRNQLQNQQRMFSNMTGAARKITKRQVPNMIPQSIQQPLSQQNAFIQQQNQFNPAQQFQFTTSNYQMMTILAPTDEALIGIRDQLIGNDSAIEQFLSNHIVIDRGSNRVFYTDHDESLFMNGQTYQTMNPAQQLLANVLTDPSMMSNIVTLSFAQNPSIKTRITNGNYRVMNGVVHKVDKALTGFMAMDVTALLDQYSSSNTNAPRAFNQFVDILRNTGILNELRQQGRRFTLFIPTNEALARYQDILNSNDYQRKKNLVYRHMCMDQNLQSTVFSVDQYGQQLQQQPQYNNNQQRLICRNALGQDLTLTKDNYGLISSYQGQAQSKVLNDFSGVYSSAYVLENTLLNQNLPNYGLNNAASSFKMNFFIALSSIFLFVLSLNKH